MTTAAVDGGFRAGLLGRLFAKADVDQDKSVSADELAALISGDAAPTRAGAIVAEHDADGDDQLSLPELTGSKFAPETLSGLLSEQEYAAADRSGRATDDRNVADSFFASADIDGDGSLSRAEYDAERTLRMAQSLDAGETAPQHMFAVRPGAFDDDKISRDDIMVGRRLIAIAHAVSLDDPGLDPDLAERLNNLQPTVAPADPAEPAQPDTATALGRAVGSAEMTQALLTRLIHQLELAQASAPTQDVMA